MNYFGELIQKEKNKEILQNPKLKYDPETLELVVEGGPEEVPLPEGIIRVDNEI